ncbi:MAG: hypothetical protein NZ929_06565 [Aigarchaeota archaeon]|nr:hypothetical protein [Aigarchaeota archaeon]
MSSNPTGLKKLSSPDSGTEDKVYGVDWNQLVDTLNNVFVSSSKLNWDSLDGYWMSDHFNAGSTETGEIGELGWQTTTGTISQQSSEAGRPGIYRATTGTTSGNVANIVLPSFIHSSDKFEIRVAVRVPTVTSVKVKIGLTSLATDGDIGASENGIFFHFDPSANANWRAVTVSAGTSTITATDISVSANTWYLLTIIRRTIARDGVNRVEFYVNNVLKATHTSNISETSLDMAMVVETATSAARTLDVDLFIARIWV